MLVVSVGRRETGGWREKRGNLSGRAKEQQSVMKLVPPETKANPQGKSQKNHTVQKRDICSTNQSTKENYLL